MTKMTACDVATDVNALCASCKRQCKQTVACVVVSCPWHAGDGGRRGKGPAKRNA